MLASICQTDNPLPVASAATNIPPVLSLTELSRRLKAPLTSIHREVDRLAEASLVGERSVGRNRMVRANPDHPASDPVARAQLRPAARGRRRVR